MRDRSDHGSEAKAMDEHYRRRFADWSTMRKARHCLDCQFVSEERRRKETLGLEPAKAQTAEVPRIAVLADDHGIGTMLIIPNCQIGPSYDGLPRQYSQR